MKSFRFFTLAVVIIGALIFSTAALADSYSKTSAQVKAGTEGATAGAAVGLGSSLKTQFETNYTNGMAVFVHAKGGLMYEASIGGQKFSFKPVP